MNYSLAMKITSALGTIISIYAIFANMTANNDPNYKMFCDSTTYNCAGLFRSRFGKGFGAIPFLPNGIYETIFYGVIGGLCKHILLELLSRKA